MLKKIITASIYSLFGASVFIFFFPWLFIKLNASLNLPVVSFPLQKPLGLVFFLLGAGNYLYCHKYFFFEGQRTPNILEKSSRLLDTGLYHYSRNPIYIGHIILLLGIFFYFGSSLLFLYVLIIFLLLNLLIIYYEEPHLKKSLGNKYEAYLRKVPRWL